ncbi:hypothetical protein [Azospirillum picis]|uniref:Uncharacterized protein n=1 Tax=Azospirillum picis TaxID=488438 RepID=A0ABU0MQ70_9PROT|nr:hypothetical protein [Azospirillum picis]MBP2302082.1 hypothetical protein [Azospirillum picis]MDQ0535627.1 hypothetical protein [Azospirillum picis]
MFKRLFAGLHKDEEASKAVPDSVGSLQDDVVRSIVADSSDLYDDEWGDRDWVHIAVNHELLIEEGRRSSTQTAVLAHRPGAPLEDLSFRMSMGTKRKLIALRDAMSREGREPWTIADITIEGDGRYKFTFGYGPPPRINGDLLHTPLKGLLERYKADRGLK